LFAHDRGPAFAEDEIAPRLGIIRRAMKGDYNTLPYLFPFALGEDGDRRARGQLPSTQESFAALIATSVGAAERDYDVFLVARQHSDVE
jgi:hypothetical protein